MSQETIFRSEPRRHIRVTLPDGSVYEGPVGTTTGELLRTAHKDGYPALLIACICNGELRELTYALHGDATLAPVLLNSSDGGRIYRRSLVFLMTTAAAELWPGCKLSVRYAVPDGGFYCTRQNAPPLDVGELQQLEDHMREIVTDAAPITKRTTSLETARQLFTERGDTDKKRLLQQRESDHLTLYTLRGHEDYYYGYMVESTAVLQRFRFIHVREGFILQYPRKETPDELWPIRSYGKLSQIFQQTDQWLHHMDVEDIGRLNQIVRDEEDPQELILIAEALHEQNVAAIAGEIRERHRQDGTRLVLIAGPSSSGKTTFAKRLAIQLLAHGLKPFTLELDNYFVDREKTPLDAKGDYNFEALEAIDLTKFNNNLLHLIQNEAVQLPRFDFHQGKSLPGRTVQINANQIVIIEGIHGLNPSLVPSIPDDLIFRVYVSALTQLNIDMHNRVPTTDVRLLRRIVRDAHNRGWSATDTLNRWSSVRQGEKNNIFLYQENADAMFNSALVYELAALRPLAEPLLLQVEPRTKPHIEAKRLLSFLRWVQPLRPEQIAMIPDTSLLREFIGGSILHDYHPGNLSEA